MSSSDFVPYQGGGTPLYSDLDQGAGEEAKARQVEPGGMEKLKRERVQLLFTFTFCPAVLLNLLTFTFRVFVFFCLDLNV